MRKPNYGKQRSASGAMLSLSKHLPKLRLPSATPPVERPRPKVNKPPSLDRRK